MSKSFRELSEQTSTPESQHMAAERTIELLREEVARLRLSAEEREALELACSVIGYGPGWKTLRGLLGRLA